MRTNEREVSTGSVPNRYDVIVVGGGIYGAAVAWEAVSRGLSVILVEKGDFGGGTSANSLKIIHGGVRYLQNLDIRRLRESMQERNRLMRIAPHLVSPLACVMPTYRDLKKHRATIWAGFKIYDLLAWDRNRGLGLEHRIPSGSIISRHDMMALLADVGFDDGGMTGGARWYDGQAYNTERLVLAFVLSARDRGACVENYLSMEEVLIERNRVVGIQAKRVLKEQALVIRGDVVIDCRGPWAVSDSIYRERGLALGDWLPDFAVATNITVHRPFSTVALGMKVVPQKYDGDSERLLFVVPWRNGSIIGTWYQRDSGQGPDDLSLPDDQLDTIIAEANLAFPFLRLRREDVGLVHRGRLPLAASRKGVEELMLRDKPIVLHTADVDGPHGLFVVQGVKYTTARQVAVEVVDALARVTGKVVKESVSDRMPLYGGDIASEGAGGVSQWSRLSRRFSAPIATRLLKNYGSNVSAILDYTETAPGLAALVPGTEDVIQAELHYIIDHELTQTLSDLILRRTDIGSLAVPQAECIEFCADLMASKLGWDQRLRHMNVAALIEHYPRWTVPKRPS